MLLEVQVFDFLPPCHHSSAAAKPDRAPLLIEIPVIDCTDVLGGVGEGHKIVARALVIVVRHCVAEAADDGFCNIYIGDFVS